jgi:hypothetical protein
MAKLERTIRNRTLALVDKALEEKDIKERIPRYYLGMSEIGHECVRYLWYSFRGVAERNIPASGLRAIQDGYKQEDIMAERLRLVPGIELVTMDTQTGEQIEYALCKGHFGGHFDGVIRGIIEAPQTWHVWENKAVNEAKFNKLDKLIAEKGEKNALNLWDYVYYCQAIIYMYCAGLTRHYLTVETPGGRQYTSCRTEEDKKLAKLLIDKAERIIFDNSIPARVSESREYYKCGWCQFKEICFDGAPALRSCRSCVNRAPIDDGENYCHFTKKKIENLNGCSKHAYIPDFETRTVQKKETPQEPQKVWKKSKSGLVEL